MNKFRNRFKRYLLNYVDGYYCVTRGAIASLASLTLILGVASFNPSVDRLIFNRHFSRYQEEHKELRNELYEVMRTNGSSSDYIRIKDKLDAMESPSMGDCLPGLGLLGGTLLLGGIGGGGFYNYFLKRRIQTMISKEEREKHEARDAHKRL